MAVVPGGGYLADMVDVEGYSTDSDSGSDENQERGNWTSRFEFLFSGLGYVIGLGNVWRFPYLVYRNGGGAFFIPYLLMLVLCGIPLVFMELAFGQYASLGPISIWKAVPLLKGVGIAMVVTSALVSVYYNVVVAWSLCYLFSSMTSQLPWATCDNSWNTIWCNEQTIVPQNCTVGSDGGLARNESAAESEIDPFCLNWTYTASNNSLDVLHQGLLRYNNPSEEFFYLSMLDISGDVSVLGQVKWKLALCLLLAWALVFICLIRGIKSSGKVMYLIVAIPFLAILILLIQSMTTDGYLDGVRYYVTPRWERLGEARVWSDAAAQVFFSLSVCWGGLSTLASYNRFQNNIYRDAILICLGDTLMSVLAGFAVFAMIGTLGKQMNMTVENVIQSDIGLAFVAYPEAISHFAVAPVWSVLFFLMISMMGLSSEVTNMETIITAVIDENTALLKKRRIWILLAVCCLFYLCGLPLTTRGGIYWLQLCDEYLGGWSVMVLSIIMSLGLCYIYGVHKFCCHIRHMTGETPSWWWKIMWCLVCPLVIAFILVFAMVDYKPVKFGLETFPGWVQAVGFVFISISLLPVPVYIVYRLARETGSLLQRLRLSVRPQTDWGPALEKFWQPQYLPTMGSLQKPLHDLGLSSIETVTDRVDFTTVGTRTESDSQSSILTGSSTLYSPVCRKRYDIRQRAILQHAYSNPQCNTSLYHASNEKLPVSLEKLPQSRPVSSLIKPSSPSAERLPLSADKLPMFPKKSEPGGGGKRPGYIVVPRPRRPVPVADKSTQTEPSDQRNQQHNKQTKRRSSSPEPFQSYLSVEAEITRM